MSKVKISFSLIIAFFLVGILSTAAFAKDPYGLKPVSQSDLSLLVPFNGNTGDPADYTPKNGTTPAFYTAVSFDVVLKDSTGTMVGTATTYQGTIATDTGKGSVTIPAGVMTPGANYTVELYKTADTGHVTLLSKSSAVVLDPHNADMYKAGKDANGNPINSTFADGSTKVDVSGTGMKNSNLTGFNNTRKNRPNQKVHGFYQNNTNSCASCHQTHTAANGESLLFKDGVYSTCSACHDGTTGAYNNFATPDASTTASISGTFNVQATGHNGSLHEADGSLKVAAAPGGNSDTKSNQYGQEFDCASCHAAHGAGSASENNLNIDPLGWGSVQYYPLGTDTGKKDASNNPILTTKDDTNGKLFNNIHIYNSVPTAFDPTGKADPATTGVTPYILVKSTASAADAANFWYSRAGVKQGDLVIQTYRWNNTKYVADYSLWLRELGYPFKANTLLKDSTGKDLTLDPNLTIVWKDAFAFGPSVANITSANVSIGIDVETNSSNIATLYDSTATGYVPDSGTEMSKYCASCHVDFLSTTRTDNTGVYSLAHRHATAQDKLTCVRCHYAHGSEAKIMHDANDNTYFTLTASGKVFDTTTADTTKNTANDNAAISYFVDPNPSSALKRYTGMSVCYACHGKGEQFMGNPNTNAPDTTTHEFLKGGDPGAAGTTGTPGGARTVISK